ncbi:MAG: S9 family peptidase [Terriglobales bacterium]
MRHSVYVSVVAAGLVAAAVALAPGARGQAPGTSAKHALTIADVMAFKEIGGEALSRDGAWFAWRATPMEGNGYVVFRQTQGAKQWRFGVGEQPPPAGYGRYTPPGEPALSSDGKWGAFIADPTHAESRRLRRKHQAIETHAGLVDLATGKMVEFARVRSFKFSGDNPDWIALEKYGPEEPAARRGSKLKPEDTPESDPKGYDVILRQLSTGAEFNLGHVGEFAFDRQGRYLAYTVSAPDRSGNGVMLRELATGATRALDSDNHAVYRQLAWNHAGTALAVLKGSNDRQSLDYRYTLLGFTGIGAGAAPMRATFDPAADASFPAHMSISPDRAAEWSEAGDAIFFGIRELRPVPGKKADADAADSVDLIIWNYQDPRLQSEQIKEEGRDRNYSYLAEYRLAGRRFIRLADDTVRMETIAPHGRYAIGLGNRPYELEGHLDGQTYDDIYVTDLATGERRPAVKKARWREEVAPDGVHFAFFRDGNYWVYNMATGASRNVTANVPTTFVNTEDDHNLDRPPIRQVGWSRDSRDLILSDNWDLWKVPIHGGTAVNLTVDGKRDGIRYRRPENFALAYDSTKRGFDLTKPIYLDAYGEWTKKDGIAVIEPGQPGARRLMFDEAFYSRLVKAQDAPVYVYTRETFKTPPDFYLAGPTMAPEVKLSDFAAQMKPFLWSSGTILVNYLGYKGDHLQGALHLPPNYVKGEEVPMVVEFYEKMSQNAYQFIRPTANGFSIPLYNSNGYAVFDPDISYKVNDPGISSAGCLIHAVKAAIATGVPDPKHIGIHGHSWGGYQTAFVVTQTHLFAAAMAGAPLTDMISMYGIIYKNTGVTNGQIFEASQGRFSGPPWELWQAYTRNSPVADVANVTTPLLMLSDYDDGAVDFTQGMEYFNALRRMHKPVVLLDYPSQNHSLSKRADQKDYTVRMMQFFDHYLKGAPMPGWYAKGVSALHMEAYMRNFQEKLPQVKAPAEIAAPAAAGGGY